jgi:hypothetical protein
MLTKSELIKVSKNELSVLKNVLGINVLNGIVWCVDIRVAVFERCLEYK